MDRLLTCFLCFVVFETDFCITLAIVDEADLVLAAAIAVSAGTSLTGKTLRGLMQNGYAVNCGIEVNNWTNFSLTNPVVMISSGKLFIPPRDILPSKREAMVAVKKSNSATGSYGSVSWLVEGKARRIVIMWSAPFDFNLYSNWLGVGITSPGETLHAKGDAWFNQMYYGNSSSSLGFSRTEYIWELNPVIYKDDVIQISGIMSTDHQAEAKITVRPVNYLDLAKSIQEHLE